MDKPLEPPTQAEVEAEAAALRDKGDEMQYAAYNTLLWVLGYGVKQPSKLFPDEPSHQPENK